MADRMNGAKFTNHDAISEEESEDYQILETELDKLDSCLSVVEGWNENLHSECVKLLERTKELRQVHTSTKLTNEEKLKENDDRS